jgi:hypothetical protein
MQGTKFTGRNSLPGIWLRLILRGHYVSGFPRASARQIRAVFRRQGHRSRMVDTTGIEPVTPTMSTWCSTAELRVLNLVLPGAAAGNAESLLTGKPRPRQYARIILSASIPAVFLCPSGEHPILAIACEPLHLTMPHLKGLSGNKCTGRGRIFVRMQGAGRGAYLSRVRKSGLPGFAKKLC